MNDLDIFIEFLNHPLGTGNPVLQRFSQLSGAVRKGTGLEQFVYMPGKRKDRVLLVAHADTFWDEDWDSDWHAGTIMEHKIIPEENIIRSGTPNFGIGADDRAGCAILWLLKDLGHSLLITNGEEHGQRGSNWLMNHNPEIANEINKKHQFAVQFDSENGTDFKCYNVGTDVFRHYIIDKTSFVNADGGHGVTDICFLCHDICAVNLSIGYYYKHEPKEEINIVEWEKVLNLCRKWLNEPDLQRFILKNK